MHSHKHTHAAWTREVHNKHMHKHMHTRARAHTHTHTYTHTHTCLVVFEHSSAVPGLLLLLLAPDARSLICGAGEDDRVRYVLDACGKHRRAYGTCVCLSSEVCVCVCVIA